MPEPAPYLIVVSELDPVARRVAERWGVPPATECHVDGAPVRRLSEHAWLLKRAVRHITDEHLDRRLPDAVRRHRPTLLFPSIHRSEQNVPCLTVHPLGNPGPAAEVGGLPRSFAPADARLMADALRQLAERAPGAGLPVTLEATHHGPLVELPALFVEIGFGTQDAPPEDGVSALAEILPRLERPGGDEVALAVGGGHYAPHFTDLVLKRRWAFGHILSRHALAVIDPPTARRAYDASEGARGFVAARAEDARLPAIEPLGPRRRDADAPRREPNARPTPSASGT